MKTNITIGRFQPFTKGHLDMIQSSSLPCIIYRINSTGRDLSVRGKKITADELLRISEYLKGNLVELTPRERELIKRPFTNELIEKELDIVKRKNKKLISDVIYVKNAYEALEDFKHKLDIGEYEAGSLICGDDRRSNYESLIKRIPDLNINLEVIERNNISGTAVRQAIVQGDKSSFVEMMPPGTDSMWEDFRNAYTVFIEQASVNMQESSKSLKHFLMERLNPIMEGGHVFGEGSDKIAKEDIKPTLNAWLQEIKKLFPKVARYWDNPVTLGSVGKKDFSGDIDIAIDEEGLKNPEDWNLDPQVLTLTYNKMIKRARTASPQDVMRRAIITCIGEYINENSDKIITNTKSAGNGVMFSEFNQIDHETGLPNGKTVQIDTNFGNVDWLTFAYYSDAYADNVKGLHRTQLMLHLFTYKGYMFKHNKGVQNKDTQEWVASNPEEAVSTLNDLYGFNLDRKTLENYHSLQKFLKDNLSEKDLHGIWDIYLKTLDSTRCDIPEDLQPYWIENQQRLGLTGKFLPGDSQLATIK